MLIFGITGGSGAGKTTVSDIFRKSGIPVIDADKAARAVTEPGEKCLGELADFFGSEILQSDGTLNRKKLADIAFSDERRLKKLNEITHKYIKINIENQLSEIKGKVAAIDGAVIIGSEVEELCAFIVSVTAKREVRIKRITARDNISAESAKKRLAAQPGDDFYIEHSKYIIRNDTSVKELELQTERIISEIKNENEV